MSLIRPLSIRTNSGFTYIGLLIVVAIMGVTLAMIGTFWSTNQKRAKEQQLIFIGNQFSNAIYAYYQNPPSTGTNPGIKQYPKRLEDLLQDNRQPNTVRYLRKIFADPMTGKNEWGLIKAADGGIVGVRSLSEAEPLKKSNFGKGNEKFADKKHYSEWQFTSVANSGTVLAANTAPGNQTPINTTPPEYQVPPVQPLPPEPTPEQRKEYLCENMRRGDASTCALLATNFGSAAGATCMESAKNRYAICTSKENAVLPALVVQHK
jgi:type II secretory pathway pseudopilin PulG